MMDIADQADLEIDNYINLTINKNRINNKHNDGLLCTGICHNPACESEVSGNQLFCDKECAQEYEYIKKQKR